MAFSRKMIGNKEGFSGLAELVVDASRASPRGWPATGAEFLPTALTLLGGSLCPASTVAPCTALQLLALATHTLPPSPVLASCTLSPSNSPLTPYRRLPYPLAHSDSFLHLPDHTVPPFSACWPALCRLHRPRFTSVSYPLTAATPAH